MIYLFRSYSATPYLFDGWSNKIFALDEGFYEFLSTNEGNDLSTGMLKKMGITLKVAPLLPLDEIFVKIDKAKGPQRIVIEASQACNLRCSYCAHTLSGSLTRQRPHRNRHLDQKTMDLIIAEYFGSEKNSVKELFFYGGEPLLNFSVIHHGINQIRKAGSTTLIQLVTNGLLLDDQEMIRFFVTQNVGLQVSLDGPSHDTHRLTLDGKGSFEKVMSNLESIKKMYPEYYHKYVSFNATIPWDSDYHETMNFFANSDLTKHNWQGQNLEIYEINRSETGDRLPEQKKNRCRNYVTSRGWTKEFRLSDLVLIQPVLFMGFRKTGATAYSFFHKGCTFYKDSIYVDVDGKCMLCEKTNTHGYLGTLGNDDEVRNGAKNYYKKLYELAAERCDRCWANKICQVCAGCIGEGELIAQNFDTACRRSKEVCRQELELYTSLKESGFNFNDAMSFMKQSSNFAEKHYTHVMSRER